MKIAKQTSRKVDFASNRFSLSHAKTYLGRLLEKASNGETVWIVSGEHNFILQEIPPIDPIPIRPPGYFADAYTPEEIQDLNRLAKSSVVRAPADLE